MKDNGSDKESMDDLFKDAFQNHSEPVDEKDFDVFMGKLEDSGYFKQRSNWRYLFLIFSVITLSGITSYWFTSKKEENTPINNNVIIIAIPDSINTFKEKEDQKELSENIETIPAPKKMEVKKDVAVQVKKVEDKVHQPKPVDTISTVTTTPVVQPVTPAKKDSLRVKYIMQVDTIIKVDSQSVNKRKFQKLKEKNK
ncbi:MAG: hypothetical protein ACK40G_01645 [Cytophagaceae bacterium]